MDTNNNQPVPPSPPNPSDSPAQPGTPPVPPSPVTPSSLAGQNPVGGTIPNSTPSGPPPFETPAPGNPTPPMPLNETPVTEPTSPAETAHQAPPSTPAPDTAPPASDDIPPATGDKKGISKALMAGVGVLIIGAFSAVFIVANMQTGDTQNYADTTSSTPAPTAAISPTVSDANLTISSPTNNSTVSSASATVVGNTFPNADVTVNDAEVKADSSGNFSTELTLEEGENIIIVNAVDEAGNAAEQEITVTYETEI